MKQLIYIVAVSAFLFLIGCNSSQKQSEQKIEKEKIFSIVQYPELKSLVEKVDNKFRVVNFWATWCAPCVAELPEFMEVNEAYKNDNNFEMILVSLDDAKSFDTKVKEFVVNNKLDTDVYLLDDNKRMNEWIPAFDSTWTGSIPATIFYKNGKKIAFKEGRLSKQELESIINQHK